MSRSKSKTTGRPRAPRKNLAIIERGGMPTSVVPRLLVMPDKARVKLVYHEVGQNMVNGAVKFANQRVQNSLAATNPAAGSNVMGSAAWAGFYSMYRINKMRLRWKVVNQETFPLTVYIVPLVVDPGVNFANLATTAMANPRAIVRYLGASAGQARSVLVSKWYSVAEITGFLGSMYDISYTAATGATPANVFYVAYGIDTNTNVMVNGIGYELDVDLEVEFFGRRYLTA